MWRKYVFKSPAGFVLVPFNRLSSCFRQINADPVTCQRWSCSIHAVPCLGCSSVLKSAVEQVFPAELSLNSPTLFLSFFPPNSTLSAVLFEQCIYKQYSYQRTCLSPVFFFLVTPTTSFPPALPLLSRIAEGLLSVTAEIKAPPESSVRTALLSSSTSGAVHC